MTEDNIENSGEIFITRLKDESGKSLNSLIEDVG